MMTPVTILALVHLVDGILLIATHAYLVLELLVRLRGR